MKLSTNFVKDYVDIDVDVKTLAEDMTKVGNEYDSAGKLLDASNLVIGEVKTCKMHPDSDHLHVCTVDVGTEVLHIVFIRTQGCFFVYTNSDCFLNSLYMRFTDSEK